MDKAKALQRGMMMMPAGGHVFRPPPCENGREQAAGLPRRCCSGLPEMPDMPVNPETLIGGHVAESTLQKSVTESDMACFVSANGLGNACECRARETINTVLLQFHRFAFEHDVEGGDDCF